MTENPYEGVVDNIDRRAVGKIAEFKLQRDAWNEGYKAGRMDEKEGRD